MASKEVEDFRKNLAKSIPNSPYLKWTDDQITSFLHSKVREHNLELDDYSEEFATDVRRIESRPKVGREGFWGTLKEFPAGIQSAWERKKGSYKAATGMAAGVFDEETEDDFMLASRRNMEKAASVGPSINDIDMVHDAGSLGRWAVGVTGETIVDGLELLGSMFVGGAAGRAASIGQAAKMKAGREISEAALEKAVQTGRMVGAAGAGVATSTAQNTGQVYADLYPYTKLEESDPNYLDPSTARAMSFGAGLGSGALDSAVPLYLFRTLTRKVGRDAASDAVGSLMRKMPKNLAWLPGAAGSASGEAFTEAFQEVIQMLTVKSHTKEDWGPQDWNRLVNAGAMGFIGGGVLGGAVHGVGSLTTAAERMNEARVEKALEESPTAEPDLEELDSTPAHVVGDFVFRPSTKKSGKVVEVVDDKIVVEDVDGNVHEGYSSHYVTRNDLTERKFTDAELAGFSTERLNQLRNAQSDLADRVDPILAVREKDVDKTGSDRHVPEKRRSLESIPATADGLYVEFVDKKLKDEAIKVHTSERLLHSTDPEQNSAKYLIKQKVEGGPDRILAEGILHPSTKDGEEFLDYTLTVSEDAEGLKDRLEGIAREQAIHFARRNLHLVEQEGTLRFPIDEDADVIEKIRIWKDIQDKGGVWKEYQKQLIDDLKDTLPLINGKYEAPGNPQGAGNEVNVAQGYSHAVSRYGNLRNTLPARDARQQVKKEVLDDLDMGEKSKEAVWTEVRKLLDLQKEWGEGESPFTANSKIDENLEKQRKREAKEAEKREELKTEYEGKYLTTGQFVKSVDTDGIHVVDLEGNKDTIAISGRTRKATEEYKKNVREDAGPVKTRKRIYRGGKEVGTSGVIHFAGFRPIQFEADENGIIVNPDISLSVAQDEKELRQALIDHGLERTGNLFKGLKDSTGSRPYKEVGLKRYYGPGAQYFAHRIYYDRVKSIAAGELVESTDDDLYQPMEIPNNWTALSQIGKELKPDEEGGPTEYVVPVFAHDKELEEKMPKTGGYHVIGARIIEEDDAFAEETGFEIIEVRGTTKVASEGTAYTFPFWTHNNSPATWQSRLATAVGRVAVDVEKPTPKRKKAPKAEKVAEPDDLADLIEVDSYREGDWWASISNDESDESDDPAFSMDDFEEEFVEAEAAKSILDYKELSTVDMAIEEAENKVEIGIYEEMPKDLLNRPESYLEEDDTRSEEEIKADWAISKVLLYRHRNLGRSELFLKAPADDPATREYLRRELAQDKGDVKAFLARLKGHFEADAEVAKLEMPAIGTKLRFSDNPDQVWTVDAQQPNIDQPSFEAVASPSGDVLRILVSDLIHAEVVEEPEVELEYHKDLETEVAGKKNSEAQVIAPLDEFKPFEGLDDSDIDALLGFEGGNVDIDYRAARKPSSAKKGVSGRAIVLKRDDGIVVVRNIRHYAKTGKTEVVGLADLQDKKLTGSGRKQRHVEITQDKGNHIFPAGYEVLGFIDAKDKVLFSIWRQFRNEEDFHEAFDGRPNDDTLKKTWERSTKATLDSELGTKDKFNPLLKRLDVKQDAIEKWVEWFTAKYELKLDATTLRAEEFWKIHVQLFKAYPHAWYRAQERDDNREFLAQGLDDLYSKWFENYFKDLSKGEQERDADQLESSGGSLLDLHDTDNEGELVGSQKPDTLAGLLYGNKPAQTEVLERALSGLGLQDVGVFVARLLNTTKPSAGDGSTNPLADVFWDIWKARFPDKSEEDRKYIGLLSYSSRGDKERLKGKEAQEELLKAARERPASNPDVQKARLKMMEAAEKDFDAFLRFWVKEVDANLNESSDALPELLAGEIANAIFPEEYASGAEAFKDNIYAEDDIVFDEVASSGVEEKGKEVVEQDYTAIRSLLPVSDVLDADSRRKDLEDIMSGGLRAVHARPSSLITDEEQRVAIEEENAKAVAKFVQDRAVIDGNAHVASEVLTWATRAAENLPEGGAKSTILNALRDFAGHPLLKKTKVFFHSWDTYRQHTNFSWGKYTLAWYDGEESIHMGDSYKLKPTDKYTAEEALLFTLAEEFAHAVTSQVINAAAHVASTDSLPKGWPRGVMTKRELADLDANSEQVLKWLRQMAGKERIPYHHNGLKNTHEMWTNFATNPEFRAWIGKQGDMPGKLRAVVKSPVKRIWEWFTKLLSRFIGRAPEPHVLNVMKEHLEELMRLSNMVTEQGLMDGKLARLSSQLELDFDGVKNTYTDSELTAIAAWYHQWGSDDNIGQFALQASREHGVPFRALRLRMEQLEDIFWKTPRSQREALKEKARKGELKLPRTTYTSERSLLDESDIEMEDWTYSAAIETLRDSKIPAKAKISDYLNIMRKRNVRAEELDDLWPVKEIDAINWLSFNKVLSASYGPSSFNETWGKRTWKAVRSKSSPVIPQILMAERRSAWPSNSVLQIVYDSGHWDSLADAVILATGGYWDAAQKKVPSVGQDEWRQLHRDDLSSAEIREDLPDLRRYFRDLKSELDKSYKRRRIPQEQDKVITKDEMIAHLQDNMPSLSDRIVGKPIETPPKIKAIKDLVGILRTITGPPRTKHADGLDVRDRRLQEVGVEGTKDAAERAGWKIEEEVIPERERERELGITPRILESRAYVLTTKEKFPLAKAMMSRLTMPPPARRTYSATTDRFDSRFDPDKPGSRLHAMKELLYFVEDNLDAALGKREADYEKITEPGGTDYRIFKLNSTDPALEGVHAHFGSDDPGRDLLAWARVKTRWNLLPDRSRIDKRGQPPKVLFVEEVQSDAVQKQSKWGGERPQFHKSWPELIMKRLVRYASDEGFDAIAWTGSKIQRRRNRKTGEDGLFYDRIYDKQLPRAAFWKRLKVTPMPAELNEDGDIDFTSRLDPAKNRPELGQYEADRPIWYVDIDAAPSQPMYGSERNLLEEAPDRSEFTESAAKSALEGDVAVINEYEAVMTAVASGYSEEDQDSKEFSSAVEEQMLLPNKGKTESMKTVIKSGVPEEMLGEYAKHVNTDMRLKDFGNKALKEQVARKTLRLFTAAWADARKSKSEADSGKDATQKEIEENTAFFAGFSRRTAFDQSKAKVKLYDTLVNLLKDGQVELALSELDRYEGESARTRVKELDADKLFEVLEGIADSDVRVEELSLEDAFNSLTFNSTDLGMEAGHNHLARAAVALLLTSTPSAKTHFTLALRVARNKALPGMDKDWKLVERMLRDVDYESVPREGSFKSLLDQLYKRRENLAKAKAQLDFKEYRSSIAERKMEELERRMEKLRRFLGEHAPVSLAHGETIRPLRWKLDKDGKRTDVLEEFEFQYVVGGSRSNLEKNMKDQQQLADELFRIVQTEAFERQFGDDPTKKKYLTELANALIHQPMAHQYHLSNIAFKMGHLQSFQKAFSRMGRFGMAISQALNKFNRSYTSEFQEVHKLGQIVAARGKELHAALTTGTPTKDRFPTFLEGFYNRFMHWYNEHPEHHGDMERASSKIWRELADEQAYGYNYSEEARRRFRSFIVATEQANQHLRNIGKKHNMSVEDDLDEVGKEAMEALFSDGKFYRRDIEQGVITVPSMINWTVLKDVHNMLQPEPGTPALFGVLYDLVRIAADPQGGDLPEGASPRQAIEELLKGRLKDTELFKFLDPFLTEVGAHSKLWKIGDIVSPERLRDAWTSQAGTPGERLIGFIDEFGEEDFVDHAEQVLKQLASRETIIRRHYRNSVHAEEEKERNPHKIIYGQHLDTSLFSRSEIQMLPQAFKQYAFFDEMTSTILLSKMLQAADFGRNAEKLNRSFEGLQDEMRESVEKYNLIATKTGIKKITAERSSPQTFLRHEKRKILATGEVRDWKEFEEIVKKARIAGEAVTYNTALRAFLGQSESFNVDNNVVMEALSTISFGAVNNLKTTATAFMSIGDIVKRLGLNPTAFKAVAGSVANIPREIAGTLLERFGMSMSATPYDETLAPLFVDLQQSLDFRTRMSAVGSGGAFHGSGAEPMFRRYLRKARTLVSTAGGAANRAKKGGGNFVPGSLRTAVTTPFSYMSNVINKSITLSFARIIDNRVRLAADVLDAMGISDTDATRELTAKELGAKDSAMDRWVTGDTEAIEWLNNRLVAENTSITRLAQDFRRRRKEKPDALPLTPEQALIAWSIAMSEVTYDGVTGKPLWTSHGPMKYFGFLLNWSLSSLSQGLEQMRNKDGKLAVRQTLRYIIASSAWLVPLSVALTLWQDWWDEEILGKPSNLRKVPKSSAIPVIGLPMAMSDPRYDTFAMIERAARGSNVMGFGQELFTYAVGGFDATAYKQDMSRRILLTGALTNTVDSVKNYILAFDAGTPATYVPDYSQVIRPLAFSVGLNGLLQHAQMATHLVPQLREVPGLSHERRVADIIGMRNTLRAHAKAIGMEMRAIKGFNYMPSPQGIAIRRMERAAYANDTEDFLDAYRTAVRLSQAADPFKDVRTKFKSRNLRNSITRYAMSEGDWLVLLSVLDADERERIMKGMNSHNYYLGLIGGTPKVSRKTTTSQYSHELRSLALN